MSSREELAELGATAILKRTAPAWWWLRKNFTLPAVLAIASLAAGAGSFLWAQHTAIRDLKRQVADFADRGPEVGKLDARLSALELELAARRQQLTDFGERIDRSDEKWARVEDAAEIRIPRRRH